MERSCSAEMPSELALSLSTIKRRLRCVDLQVAVDVGEARVAAHRVRHLLRPLVELRPIEALHDELEFGSARASADPQVLHRCRVRVDAGNARRVAAQVGEHLCSAGRWSRGLSSTNRRPLLRPELPRCADDRGDVGHVGRAPDTRPRPAAAASTMACERDVLPCLGRDRELADVFLREEALRRREDEPDRAEQAWRKRP